MGLPCLPESPGLPEGGDTYNSGFSDTDCLAENCQAQCTETSISDTGDICCRNQELRSSRAHSFSGQEGIEEVKSLPYPRCWVLTCRLMPTMERKTLPQLGHRHLYITFTEFWWRDGPCHPLRGGSIPSTGRRLSSSHPAGAGTHPPWQQYLSLARSGFVKEKGVGVGLEAVVHLGRAQSLAGVLGAARGMGG